MYSVIQNSTANMFYADVCHPVPAKDSLNAGIHRAYTRGVINAVRNANGISVANELTTADQEIVDDELLWLYCMGRAAALDPGKINVLLGPDSVDPGIGALIWEFDPSPTDIGMGVMVYVARHKTYAVGTVDDTNAMLDKVYADIMIERKTGEGS